MAEPKLIKVVLKPRMIREVTKAPRKKLDKLSCFIFIVLQYFPPTQEGGSDV